MYIRSGVQDPIAVAQPSTVNKKKNKTRRKAKKRVSRPL